MYIVSGQKNAFNFYYALKNFSLGETVVYNNCEWNKSNLNDKNYFLSIANTYVRQYEVGLRCLFLGVQIDKIKEYINRLTD